MTNLRKELIQYAKNTSDFDLYEYLSSGKGIYQDLLRLKQGIKYVKS